MSKRITKDIAKEAAIRMACKLYNEKLERQQNLVTEYGGNLAKKYIPSPVLAVIHEYPSYFYNATSLLVSALYERNGITDAYKWLHVEVRELPYYGRNIYVDVADYKTLKALVDKLTIMKKDKDKFIDTMTQTLYSLRTDKKVMEMLPEALEYMKFPEEFAPPVDVKSYDCLRQLLKGLKNGKIKENI